jgi:hypothetical protein
MKVEEARRRISVDREGVDDTWRYERPGLRADSKLAVLEPEPDFPCEDEEALRVSRMDVRRRSLVPRLRTNAVDADLLEVGEKDDVDLVTGEALTVADLEHELAG